MSDAIETFNRGDRAVVIKDYTYKGRLIPEGTKGEIGHVDYADWHIDVFPWYTFWPENDSKSEYDAYVIMNAEYIKRIEDV